MNQLQVIDWIDGTKFEGYLLVRTSEQRITQAGLNFLNLTLADKSAEINAKVWDVNATPPEVATIIKVRGVVISYNGRLQFKVDKFRTTNSNDNIDMSYFAPSAPRPSEEMINDINKTIKSFKSVTLKDIVFELVNNNLDKLLFYPAAQRIHHAEIGGLLHHITDMLKLANAIEPVYEYLDWDLVKAGIIIHDLSKLDELDSNNLGIVKDYTKDGLLIGHLVMGVSQIELAAKKLNTPKELTLLLQHMMI
ncbi:MAG: CMP-binding protein, partial [Christensenellaceae bacterium]|nr:CMP-binding protein [Christensenellaceae bacterium]